MSDAERLDEIAAYLSADARPRRWRLFAYRRWRRELQPEMIRARLVDSIVDPDITPLDRRGVVVESKRRRRR